MRTKHEIERELRKVEELLYFYLMQSDSDIRFAALLIVKAWTLEWVLGVRN